MNTLSPEQPFVTIPQDRLPALIEYHRDQINNPGWDDVAAPFGVTLPQPAEQGSSAADAAAAVEERAAALPKLVDWDTRDGKERQNTPLHVRVEAAIADPEGRATFYEGLGKLGMIGTNQGEGLQIVAGAKVDSSIARALHARGNMRAYAGSVRPLPDDEQAMMATYFPDVAYEPTEAGSMLTILEHLHPERELIEGDDQFKAYETPEGLVYWTNAPIAPELPVLPDDKARDRANTADSLHFLAQRVNGLAERVGSAGLGDTVTIVSNDVYAFQGVDGHHILRGVHGVPTIQLARFTPQHAADLLNAHFTHLETPAQPKARTASTYAQEVRSKERSLRRLAMTIQASQQAQR